MIVFTGFLPLQSLFIENKKKTSTETGFSKERVLWSFRNKGHTCKPNHTSPRYKYPLRRGRIWKQKRSPFFILVCRFRRKVSIFTKQEGLSMAGLEGSVVSCRNVDEWKAHFQHGVDSKKLVCIHPPFFV